MFLHSGLWLQRIAPYSDHVMMEQHYYNEQFFVFQSWMVCCFFFLIRSFFSMLCREQKKRDANEWTSSIHWIYLILNKIKEKAHHNRFYQLKTYFLLITATDCPSQVRIQSIWIVWRAFRFLIVVIVIVIVQRFINKQFESWEWCLKCVFSSLFVSFCFCQKMKIKIEQKRAHLLFADIGINSKETHTRTWNEEENKKKNI